MPRCDVIRIVGLSPDSILPQTFGLEVLIDIEVPAYTLLPETFRQRISDTVNLYMAQSLLNGTKPSVGDFALFLLSQASKDPREQEEDGSDPSYEQETKGEFN